jgi:hypothetical protein
MNIHRSLLLMALLHCGACLAAPLAGASAPANAPPGDSAFALANLGTGLVESPFMRGTDVSSPPTPVAAPAATIAAFIPVAGRTPAASPNETGQSRPAKGLVLLCAFGLVAWQLRRKQLALRTGQLYVTGNPRQPPSTVARLDEARRAPAGGVQQGASRVHAGAARAAR